MVTGVTIVQYAYICNGTHDLLDYKLPLVVGDIVIDDDVFVGAKAIICQDYIFVDIRLLVPVQCLLKILQISVFMLVIRQDL